MVIEMYEYACHEGNSALEHILKGDRVYEQAAADAKGLAPPDTSSSGSTARTAYAEGGFPALSSD
jgi:hypothetical protein